MHVMFYVISNNNVFRNDDVTEWSSHTWRGLLHEDNKHTLTVLPAVLHTQSS